MRYRSRALQAFPVAFLAVSGAEDPLQRAEALQSAASWQDLETHAARWTGRNPKAAAAWGYLGVARTNLGRGNEAEKDFEMAVELDPSFSGGWFNLARIRASNGSDRAKIADCLDAIVKIAPTKGLALLEDPTVHRALLPVAPILDLGRRPFSADSKPTWSKVPHYPAAARKNRIQGSVWVDLLVDCQGRVIEVGPCTGPKELVAVTPFCAVQFRFSPTMKDGNPVAYRVLQEVPFKLR